MQSTDQVTESWNNFITALKDILDQDEIEAWVNRLILIQFQPDLLIIGGVNQFFCNWIKDHHYKLVRDNLFINFSNLNLDPDFELLVQVWKQNQDVKPITEEKVTNQKTSKDGLNPLFSFENFVNGSNSDIAYAAATAVGDNVSDNKYNPLFICGDVGLGKTHLIQAIGIRAKQSSSHLKVQYTNSERFTNEVINGIRFRNIQDVRNKYRNIDLLLIDDIQFLERKESTQEEFFHIFNELIQSKKQIIITADRYPREIKGLQDRLVNRFNSGMVARIGRPDFETRVAIIRNRVDQMQVPLSQEIINFIASSVKTNVRDILGILIHLEASWSLLGQEISIDSTKRVLKEVLNIEENPLTIDNIIKAVCNRFEVKITDIMSDKRDKEISKTRQIAMYISRELTGLSFPVIGKHFGGKNHTTVIQACKKTKEWLEKDPEINQTVTTIIRELSI